MIVLSVVGGRLGGGSRSHLLLWLRLLVLSWGCRLGRGWLDGWGRHRSRGSTGPRGDKVRGSWLGNIVTSVGNNFANLFDFLSLGISYHAYPTAFLLLGFILGLVRCMPNRG